MIAGAVALPVNRWLIARGKGHAVVHATGVHGGLSPRAVGIAAVIAFVFGTSVLAAEIFATDEPADDDEHSALVDPLTPAPSRSRGWRDARIEPRSRSRQRQCARAA